LKNEISDLLQGISKEEFERFGDYIKSPYFNKLPRLVKLFDYLNGRYSQAGIESITRESISRFMYPEEEFKNESIRKLLSDFARLLEKFLAQEEFEKNDWDKKIYILRGLRTRHYDDKFFKRLKEFKVGHKNSTLEIDEFYETNSKLISEEYEYRFNSKFGDRNEINQEKSDALDYEFISKKLFLFQYMHSREYVISNLRYDYTFYSEIEAYIIKNKEEIIQENPELYRNYLSLLFYFKNFDRKVLKEIETFIKQHKYYRKRINKPYWEFINLCTSLTNLGYLEYYEEVFDFLKLLDDNELILEGKTLNHYFFKIAVHASIYKREFNWIENFIAKYKKYIKYDFKEDMINLTYAKLSLAKNEFAKAKNYADKVSFKDYLHYISSKQILLKIAYEEDDFNSIILTIDTIKKYFYSHSEIPEVYRIGTEKFMEYISKLLKIKEKFLLNEDIEYEIDKFRDELEKEKREISFSDWLLEKTQLIKK
jgi:hypothetical protein